ELRAGGVASPTVPRAAVGQRQGGSRSASRLTRLDAPGARAYHRKMPADPPDPAKPSSWSRLPAEPAAEPALPGERDREAIRVVAARAGAVVRDGAKRVGAGIRRAQDAFAAPSGAELEGLLAGVDLPEIGGDGDALVGLAIRLDREADF